MKIFILAIFSVTLVVTSAEAFRSTGDINKYLSFRRLQVEGGYLPRACAQIRNKSKQDLYIFADLFFESRTKTVDVAKFHIKISADSDKNYCSHLKYGNHDAKDALLTRWDVYMLEVDGAQSYLRGSNY